MGVRISKALLKFHALSSHFFKGGGGSRFANTKKNRPRDIFLRKQTTGRFFLFFFALENTRLTKKS